MFLLLFSEDKTKIDTRFLDIMPAGLSFTHASMGSRWTSFGRIEIAAVNTPRFDYDPVTRAPLGLLIEEQRTNTVKNSIIDAATWPWLTEVSIGDYFETAPDGTSTMCSLKDTAVAQNHYVDGQDYKLYTSGVKYAYSVFAKKGTAHILQIPAPTGTGYANFNLDTGVVSASSDMIASIQNCGSGIYRCSAIFTSSSSEWYPAIKLALTGNDAEATRIPYYLGTGQYLYVWGAQNDWGSSSVSSYIPTNGSATTRAADQLSFTIPSGVSTLRYFFDNNSTQDVSVSAGSYTVPTDLNRPHIKRIMSL